MSRSSVETRPVHRAAGNMIVILFALLLAALSTAVPGSFRSAGDPTPAAATAPPSQTATIAQPRHESTYLAARGTAPMRDYHPAFETSNSAGALGFSMLVSLCVLFLLAGLGPTLLRTLRHPHR